MLIRFIYLKVGDVLVDRLNKMIMKAERICGTEQMCAGFIDPSEREPESGTPWDIYGTAFREAAQNKKDFPVIPWKMPKEYYRN